jgi:hypothetical protein
MSTAVTMQDLELETAELLPARETLGVFSVSRSFNHQFALLSGNNVASGNNIALFAGSQASDTSAVGNYIG